MSIETRSCALLAIALGACAVPVRLGMPCERSSECSAPLVCASGRCREECTEHRDCPLGARCLVGSDGLGVCTLPDDACSDARTCGEDLECRGGSCYDGCPLGTCPAGGLCIAGACERPPPGGADAGPPLAQRRSCAADDQCAAGERCGRLMIGGRFACRQRCTTTAECETGDTTRTCTWTETVDAGEDSLCTIPCDPFAAESGCPAGEACDALVHFTPIGVNDIAAECRPIDPAMRARGESCEVTPGEHDDTLCAAGVSCAPSGTCEPLCTVGGTFGAPCPAGAACDASPLDGMRVRGAAIGVCAIP